MVSSIYACGLVISYFGSLKQYFQVDYDYDERNFAVGSFIRESSSRFGANRRATNFYTFGAFWILTKEEFMEDQIFFNFLKLRANYDVTGNSQIVYHILGLYRTLAYAIPNGVLKLFK